MVPPPPKSRAAESASDMARLRHGVEKYLERSGTCDFETINVILTLKRTAADLENVMSGYCKPYDLSPGRLNVIMVLNSQVDQTMALSEIGDYLVVSRPNITGLIDGLVEDGLVKRISHPDDRRMVLAQLTEQGKDFIRKFVPRHHRAIGSAMAPMSKQEKRQLVQLLDKVRSHIHKVALPVSADGDAQEVTTAGISKRSKVLRSY